MNTEDAIIEMLNVAFHHFSGVGPVGARVLRENNMEQRTCTIEGCGRNHYGHGYCSKHYKRWKKGDDLYRIEAKRSVADPRYFWAKAAVSDNAEKCWEWQAGLSETGYGVATAVIDGVSYQRAHRLAFYFATSHHPGEQFVLHKCDNRRCINPSHLFLGDHNDNMADMNAKGRRALGEDSGRALLTTNDVVQIKSQLQQGRMQKEMADIFGVSPSTVNAIAKGRNWRHVGVSL